MFCSIHNTILKKRKGTVKAEVGGAVHQECTLILAPVVVKEVLAVGHNGKSHGDPPILILKGLKLLDQTGIIIDMKDG